ncbi:MAG: glycosyltransferase, partial [Promethearchaeota archaeon]
MNLKKLSDVDVVMINQLNEIPLISIIIPAWKENENLKLCLNAINQLSYPKLNVIVNAGGSKETIQIAENFRNNPKFTIIHQKEGEGKIKAINDCLTYIEEGLVYLIDADILLNDDVLLKMVYQITNKSQNGVVSEIKPHHSQFKKSIVKYNYINRNLRFRHRFARYLIRGTGPNTLLNYSVIKSIGKFTEKKLSDDGRSLGLDIFSKGYKIFHLVDTRVDCLTYPINIKKYCSQNIRWLENSLISYNRNKFLRFIKFFIFVIFQLYLLIFPFFLFLHI